MASKRRGQPNGQDAGVGVIARAREAQTLVESSPLGAIQRPLEAAVSSDANATAQFLGNLLDASTEYSLEMARGYKGHIDLVLTDLIMPQMLGSELAPRLVARRPDLRVLYMSGFAQPALGAGGTLSPEAALLDKPFTEPALLARVRQVLEAHA